MDSIDMSLVDWSRAQFALTVIYHWIFVPLTLGLSFIVAFMHTTYYKTGDEQWKNITKFWMKIFGINFAIGVATGIILEFEFGTNWSNYSWIVGDIFGAPLAIEGIVAFFLESTFIAVMFFGWDRVSKRFHMLSSWFVAFGSNLSALWILVANAWMQNPVGTKFNPDTVRNEMVNFWDILFSPTATTKFLHTISSGYVTASLFVVGVSAWFLLRNRHILFAKRSILIAGTFGLIGSLFIAMNGDATGYDVAQHQPMKLAAMEGMYKGKEGAGLKVMGILTPGKQVGDNKEACLIEIEIPKMLSILAERDPNAFVPGIDDIVYGNPERNIISTKERMAKGKLAIQALADYKTAKKNGDKVAAEEALTTLEANYEHFGYGYFKDEKDIVPNVPIVFYSFRLMVGLGGYFIVFFILIMFYSLKKNIETKKILLRLAVWSIPLGFLAAELGWIVAEVGRQPWTIQDLLPTMVSTSHLSTSTVQITFWLFVVLFTALFITEAKIMIYQIKKGPKEGEN